jgi:ribosome-associated toxin RatA of RatAB toxin-antitoxin module
VTKKHVAKRILKTHPMHLFRIIEDVDQYSKFLPLCSHSKILKRFDGGFQAVLTVGLPPLFEETYVSQVLVKPEVYTIEAKSIESKLFDSLRSRWKLFDHTEGDRVACKIDFEVEMTVRDPVIVATLDNVLQQVAQKQVDAFEKRCQELPLPSDLQSTLKQ